MVKSAYIHIPFCKSKCYYCSFVSFPILERKGEYLQALRKQIGVEYKGDILKTLYFGGGTPSLLTVNELAEILSLFNLSQDSEVTLELNPETVNLEFFKALRNTSINRLSIGVQSFDDEILKKIGRRHKSSDVIKTLEAAKFVGFDNISLDFIYGLPNQTLESFISDLKRAVELGVQHISLYGLKIDEGCFFAKNYPENIADEDLQAQMYLKAIETLESSGFEHYEISNFARDNKHSNHNINYWENQEYYGFGLAAHGYCNKIRYSNTLNLDEYLKNPLTKDFSKNVSLQEQLEEEIFLGLRLKKGIDVTNINQKFGIDFEKKYEKILSKYILTGHLINENLHYLFSNEGFLVSNLILSEFIE